MRFPPPGGGGVGGGARRFSLARSCGGEINPHPNPPPTWGREEERASSYAIASAWWGRRLSARFAKAICLRVAPRPDLRYMMRHERAGLPAAWFGDTA